MKYINTGIVTIVFTAIVLLAYISFYEDKQKFLRVVFLDVGQGDAIYIKAPNGNDLMIDTGANNSVLRSLSKEIPFWDRYISSILLTHPDLDHIGGAVPILESYHVSKIIFASSTKETDATIDLNKAIQEEGSEIIYVDEKDKIYLDTERNIYLEVLFPEEKILLEESNDQSIVVKLSYDQICFILTGDASVEVEEIILKKNKNNIDCEVLKAGHHGSKTSSSEIFVNSVSPEYTIISAGFENRYGHPHQEVLNILDQSNTEVLYTWDGNIIFETDGKEIFKF